jgi:2-dehydropantoate 2-reductase
MTVSIFGCGALGSLLAFKLVRSGVDIRVCQRPGAQFDAVQANGITFLDREGNTEIAKCSVVHSLDGLEPSDVVLVLVKAYQTEEAALQIKGNLSPNGIVLTLQNGLGNAETLARELGEDHVAAGTCTYGAHRVGPGIVAWGGDGVIRLGPWKRGRDVFPVEDLLERAGLVVKVEPDPRRALWEKVILNASVNTVSALTRLKNGQLLEVPGAVNLMKELAEEGIRAAKLAGEEIDNKSMWELVRSVLYKTAENRTSMLQDVESGRETEVDAIVGTLVEQARSKGETLPRLETVYSLVKCLGFGVEKRLE